SNTELGYHMVGSSAIWSPNGEKLTEAEYISVTAPKNEAEILYAVIDPCQFDNKAKNRIKSRRPELYHDLMLYTGPWDISEKENFMANDCESTSTLTAVLQYEPEMGNKQINFN